MNYRKKSIEELPHEETKIWSCVNEDCNEWLRDNFAFEYEPVCSRCGTTMVSSVKLLPALVNFNKVVKFPGKA